MSNASTIINPEDVRTVRPIAENILDVKRIQPYIREVETLDVMPAIGVSLYKQISLEDFQNDLQATGSAQIATNSGKIITITVDEWGKMMNGDYFTCNNTSCSCGSGEKYSAGLISAISYLAYARMLPNQPLNVTAFGVVQKTTTLSEPVDEKTLFRAANEARKIGLEYLKQAVEHLTCAGLIDNRTRKTKSYKKFKAIG